MIHPPSRQIRVAALVVPLFCLTALTIGPTAAAAPPPDLDWRNDPTADQLLPSRQGHPLLLYFTAVWCGPCRLLEREVFTHPTGQAELQNFDLVRLDLDSEPGRAVADSFRVANVPTFVMLDPAGQEIERITGYRSRRLLVHDLARFRAGQGTRDDLERRLSRAPADPVLQSELGLRHHARLDLAAADVTYRVLLVKIPPWPSKQGARARAALRKARVPVLDAEIPQAAAFVHAALRGRLVRDVRDRRAASLWSAYESATRELQEVGIRS